MSGGLGGGAVWSCHFALLAFPIPQIDQTWVKQDRSSPLERALRKPHEVENGDGIIFSRCLMIFVLRTDLSILEAVEVRTVGQ